jgi:predicted nucleic acid-binding Zn ribbon protein
MDEIACSLDDCDRPAKTRGYCQTHYVRHWRNGTTDLIEERRKDCARCGEAFPVTSNRKKFCSDACRLGERACRGCGATFTRTGSWDQKYCSSECWYSTGARTAPPVACGHCGKSINAGRRFCSVACSSESKRERVVSNCRLCGVSFEHPKGRARQYCSQKCSARATSVGATRPDGARTVTNTGYVKIKVGKRWVLEHRHVMEQALGRALSRTENVHHINGDRSDNRLENLELWKLKSTSHPAGVRGEDYHCPGCLCSQFGMHVSNS